MASGYGHIHGIVCWNVPILYTDMHFGSMLTKKVFLFIAQKNYFPFSECEKCVFFKSTNQKYVAKLEKYIFWKIKMISYLDFSHFSDNNGYIICRFSIYRFKVILYTILYDNNNKKWIKYLKINYFILLLLIHYCLLK